MTGPRKLLAAAALTMTAACGASRPAMRTASIPAPTTEAATTTTAPQVEVIDDVAPVEVPVEAVVETVATPVAATPVEEAAAPRCDEHGRPLAGNVRVKKTMDVCS